MKKEVKEQILELLETLGEAHAEIQERIHKQEYDLIAGLLADCQESALFIGNTIERFGERQREIIEKLEEYCELLYHISAAWENSGKLDAATVGKDLEKCIGEIYGLVKDKIKVLKVVFFPYKAAMWTSLASIWKAAQQDSECDAKVVVIPYYTLDSQGNKEKLVYEAELFPAEVPVVHYSQYSIEQELPDIVFIHNPYDGGNSVTRVPEQYYSYRLKLYTKQLVYSPYCLLGYYDPQEGSFLCLTNGAQLADKVLVQSERVKQIYVEHKIPENRVLALGSPKVDAIVEGMKKSKVYPEGWERKLKGRKVFLLNTHLSYFIRGHDGKLNNPNEVNFAEWHHENIFENLLGREGCALIWRPHPLLKAMLKSRDLHLELEFVEEWECRIRESENGVIDENGEYDTSFRISDAFITTYSTMIAEYMILGKPVCIIQYPLDEENSKNSPVDYRHNYYMERRGGPNRIGDFIQMVLDGEDFLYKQRMEDLQRAFGNLEGTIGRNIYKCLKDEENMI